MRGRLITVASTAALTLVGCGGSTPPERPAVPSGPAQALQSPRLRSLFGLHESLVRQEKTADAGWVKRAFDDAWKNADTTLTLDTL